MYSTHIYMRVHMHVHVHVYDKFSLHMHAQSTELCFVYMYGLFMYTFLGQFESYLFQK